MASVLIIEDEQDILENIAEILNFQSYVTFTANNGRQGINIALEKKPDLILCDILMPMINGYDVLQKIREHDEMSHIPFIFITALSERENFRKGMTIGADDYLSKPFTHDELTNAVSSLLHKQQTRETYFRKQLTQIEQESGQRLLTLEVENAEKNEQIRKIKKQNETLNEKLQQKDVELMEETMRIMEVNNKVKELEDTIVNELKGGKLSPKERVLLSDLKSKINTKTILFNNWASFQLKFNQAFPGYIGRLTKRFKNLTQYEIIMTTSSLMGLNTHQMANMLNISTDSVRKSRYRLKKKLGLKKEDDLLNFIHSV
jgi:DNA-binding response OmpR family regulator/DNA-binding CsgD family transcriptional regulator